LPSLSAEEIAEVFARMDSDRDGQVSLEEFEAGIRRPYGAEREGVVYQKLPARFRVLDADANGFLDAHEYAGLAPRWQGSGEPPSFEAADVDKDGRIDFREFAREHAPHDDGDATPPEATASANEAATGR
jgi:Ca2+-binding EF-hand superfamily protein